MSVLLKMLVPKPAAAAMKYISKATLQPYPRPTKSWEWQSVYKLSVYKDSDIS